jgi:hypothetical protein
MLRAWELTDVAENIVEQSALRCRLSRPAVPDILHFAELYPEVAVRTLMIEVIHAQRAIPAGADDRREIVATVIASRLDGYPTATAREAEDGG